MVDKSCISTVSGKRFDPTLPEYDDIVIEDIAHALSLITRANGHFNEFYSVARHSINCAYEAEKRGYNKKIRLLCLLHDAAEAYIGDMTRPLKAHMPLFVETERKYQKIIIDKFIREPVTPKEKDKVRSIDDSLLYHEFLRYNGEKLFDEPPALLISLDGCIKTFGETESEFLSLFDALSKNS